MEIYDDVYPDNIPEGWEPTFSDAKKGIKQTAKDIKKRKKKYVPHSSMVFNAYRYIRPEDVKVVIIGQDVYHKFGLACGLAFSTNGTVVPPSLKNIYKEIKANYPDFKIPNHGDLSAWCKQGVMLLNASLTTEVGEANAHKGLWMSLIESTVRTLTNMNKNIIWVMWGGNAQRLSTEINKRGIELKCGHPSPLGANAAKPFSGCKHFIKINKKLVELGKPPINWNLPENPGESLESSDDTLESSDDTLVDRRGTISNSLVDTISDDTLDESSDDTLIESSDSDSLN